MAESTPLVFRLIVFLIALFWASVTVVGVLIGMVKKGPIKFFQVKDRKRRPACMEEPTYGTHSFITLKNLKLHYVAHGPEDKPLMLFLHGFPECWFSWRHQIEEFSKDYRTVAVDMRGYGESDKPKGIENYTMGKLTGDVKELIEGLGYSKCVLVGHDWGGAVTGAFAIMYPELVERLILCNIPHPLAFNDQIKSSMGQLLKSWYMFLFQIPFLPELLIKSYDYQMISDVYTKTKPGIEKAACDADEVEAYKFSLAQPGGLTGPINYYRATFQYKEPRFPNKQITVPTLMIWGEQDDFLEKGMAEKSAKYIPDFTLRYIPEASHWVTMDCPTQVNRHMRDFLKKDK